MLQIGHLDPLKVAFDSLESPGVYPTHAGSIGHVYAHIMTHEI